MDANDWTDKVNFLDACYLQEVEDNKANQSLVIQKLNEIEIKRLDNLKKEHEINMYVAERLVQMFKQVESVNVIQNAYGSFAVSNEGVFLGGDAKAFKSWLYLIPGGDVIKRKRNWTRMIILWISTMLLVLAGCSYTVAKFNQFIGENFTAPDIQPRTNWSKENY